MRKWLFVALLTVFACGIVPLPEPTATPSPTLEAVSTCDYVVTVDRLNMRTGPGTEYAGLLILRKGERVYDVTDMGNGWWRVSVFRLEETTGYVNAAFLKGCE